MVTTPHILIVEDDPMLRSLMVMMFRRMQPDFRITEAGDGHMAHQLYRQDGADVIITDERMPLMSGSELIHTLRTAGVTIPIVMVSSERPQILDGCTVFLTKPVLVDELLTTVTCLVASRT